MNFCHRTISLLAITVLLFVSSSGLAWSQEPDSPEVVAQTDSLSYPRRVTSEAGVVVVHTPQIDTWNDFASIEARVAVEVTPAGEDEAVFGVAEFSADTDPNLELRVVAVENVAITATSFPVSDEARRELLDQIVRSSVQSKTHYIPLDVMLSYIAPDAALPEEDGLSFEPPPIFYSSTPAVLLMTDGEPLLAPIPDTKLQYVVNTNWDLFRYRDKEWYLRHESRWLKNKNLSGEWKFDNSLPRNFKKLPDDGNFIDAKAAIPPTKGDKNPPTVFVSDRPAELIVTDGQPQHRTIGGSGLKYVEDTESDVFRYESIYYYLVSGRWFSAGVLRGPWKYVTKLPDVFSTIPADHEKGHVLAAVPNTNEARLAVLEATLPRKATVSRDAGKNVSVIYQGDEPVFELISGTDVERVVNSPNDVLKYENAYYLCDNAVWYLSMHPDGPWTVADSIPAAIYSIPPSSASYHVTHVHIYEDESDSNYVSTGYTSGYFGVYVAYGVPMYGSGWYYPPYYGYYPYGGYPYYPYYYAYPYSYGASSWYNPNTGMYGRSGSVYGPYGGYGRGSAYNPQTGAYARGEAVWDNNEIAGRGVAYNPRTGTGIATHRYANESGGWGESLVTHNDKWIETQSQWDADSRTTDFRTSEGGSGTIERERNGNTVTGSGEFQRGDQTLSTRSSRSEQGTVIAGETGAGQQGAIGRSENGDLYAGKNGQVYRRNEDGWQQNTGDGWNPVEVPDERAAQIDQARTNTDERRDSFDQNRTTDFSRDNRPTREQTQSALNSRGLADGLEGRANRTNRTFDSSQFKGSFDSSRRSELNRNYNARSSGYQRYNNRLGNSSGNTSLLQTGKAAYPRTEMKYSMWDGTEEEPK